MITSRLEQRGDEYVVTIPPEDVERLGLVAGKNVTIEVRELEDKPVLPPDLMEIFEAEFERGRAGLEYFKDRKDR